MRGQLSIEFLICVAACILVLYALSSSLSGRSLLEKQASLNARAEADILSAYCNFESLYWNGAVLGERLHVSGIETDGNSFIISGNVSSACFSAKMDSGRLTVYGKGRWF